MVGQAFIIGGHRCETSLDNVQAGLGFKHQMRSIHSIGRHRYPSVGLMLVASLIFISSGRHTLPQISLDLRRQPRTRQARRGRPRQ